MVEGNAGRKEIPKSSPDYLLIVMSVGMLQSKTKNMRTLYELAQPPNPAVLPSLY
jgi:hypothetical protein